MRLMSLLTVKNVATYIEQNIETMSKILSMIGQKKRIARKKNKNKIDHFLFKSYQSVMILANFQKILRINDAWTLKDNVEELYKILS